MLSHLIDSSLIKVPLVVIPQILSPSANLIFQSFRAVLQIVKLCDSEVIVSFGVHAFSVIC
jgi:hypothetical protein